jgi:hypothetical protein
MATRVLVLAALVLVAACSKPASIDDSPPAETFRIDEDCKDMDSCCMTKCQDYCSSAGGTFDRQEINGKTCICFCAER